MDSINFKRSWIEDSEYNIVDHLEKKDTDIISIKKETFEVVHTNIVASII